MLKAQKRTDCRKFIERSEITAGTRAIRRRHMEKFAAWLEEGGYIWVDIDWRACIELRNLKGDLLGYGPIDRDLVEEYLATLVERGTSRGEISACLSTLRGFLESLVEAKVLRENPTDGISYTRGPRKEKLSPNLTELRAFLEALRHLGCNGERDYTIGYVLAWGGYRVSELLHLQVEDIVVEERMLRLYATKTRPYELRPIAAPALKRLLAWIESPQRPQSVWVFPGPTPDKPLSFERVWDIFRRAARTARIEGKVQGTHALRRAFATLLLEGGMHPQNVSQAMGHAKEESLLAYASVQARKKIAREALRRSRLIRLWDTGRL